MTSRQRKQAEWELLDYINKTPALLSLLYDLDLLPEQTLHDINLRALMTMVCVGFRAGVEAKTACAPRRTRLRFDL